jgi:uncharacterized membrane protein YhaH (DUF805 family)
MTLSSLLFSFQGRIGRKAFWFAIAINIAVSCAVALIGRWVLGSHDWILGLPIQVVLLVSGLAVSAKRWHDRDKSAWWLLIGLVPLIGGIWALVENGFLRGTLGPNRFGPDPLGH